MSLLPLLAVLFLAWSNGANDNFKGVATLYGSGAASYRAALAWATAATLLGALCAAWLSGGLIAAFSAKGLFVQPPPPALLGAAALGGALTVLAATRLGLPVSTTHALTGALLGAGLSTGAAVNAAALGKSFVLPLLLGPVLAVALTAGLYALVRRLAPAPEACACVTEGVEVQPGGAVVGAAALKVATAAECAPELAAGQGLTAGRAVDGLHYLSAGAVCFARALNDAPKIVGIVLGAQAAGVEAGVGGVAAAMVAGGLLHSRRVAETMSRGIVPLDATQGLASNLATAALVVGASRLGVPVSTTHVATGGILGVGLVAGGANWRKVATILLAWVTTLPLGALLGALAARLGG